LSLPIFDVPAEALHYVEQVKRRVPEFEELISSDSLTAYFYARDFIKGRWYKAEKTIAIDANYSLRYANDVVHGPWPEGEIAIKTWPEYAYQYADCILKRRWPEGEESIYSDPYLWNRYYLVFLLQKHYKEKVKWEWLHNEGYTDTLFSILNYIGISPKMQEDIIQHRPDLIGKIDWLDDRLREKYQNELNLSGIEI
jgi:hypothetical protein